MTRVEAIEEEIKKLSSEEMAELREWITSQQQAEVSRKGKYTSIDIHRMLFPDGPPPYRTDEELRKDLEDAIIEDDERSRY